MFAGSNFYEFLLDMGLPIIGISIIVFMGLISLTINYIYPKISRAHMKKQSGSKGISGKSENINSNQNKIA